MKKLLTSLVLVLLIAGSSFGQDYKKVGFGIGTTLNLSPGTLDFQSIQTIRVPINISQNLRVEPYFGILGSDDKVTRKLEPTAFRKTETNSLIAGAGLFYVLTQESGNFYLGVSASKYSSEDEVNDKGEDGTFHEAEEKSGWIFSPTLGAEYYFSPSFSLGLEAGMGFMSGEIDYSVEENNEYSTYKQEFSQKSNDIYTFTTLTVKYFIF